MKVLAKSGRKVVHGGDWTRSPAFTVSLLWEPRDLWVGVYWTRERKPGWRRSVIEVYVCVVPCLPLKLRLLTRGER